MVKAKKVALGAIGMASLQAFGIRDESSHAPVVVSYFNYLFINVTMMINVSSKHHLDFIFSVTILLHIIMT